MTTDSIILKTILNVHICISEKLKISLAFSYSHFNVSHVFPASDFHCYLWNRNHPHMDPLIHPFELLPVSIMVVKDTFSLEKVDIITSHIISVPDSVLWESLWLVQFISEQNNKTGVLMFSKLKPKIFTKLPWTRTAESCSHKSLFLWKKVEEKRKHKVIQNYFSNLSIIMFSDFPGSFCVVSTLRDWMNENEEKSSV